VIDRVAQLPDPSPEALLAGPESDAPGARGARPAPGAPPARRGGPAPAFAPATLCIRRDLLAAVVRANIDAIREYRAALDVSSEAYPDAEALLAERQRLLAWIEAHPARQVWVDLRPSRSFQLLADDLGDARPTAG